MKINLSYKGKDYNFDIPKSATVDYIKELSSEIINSDKSLLDINYNNPNKTKNDDKTLIRNLFPDGEKNTILTMEINKYNKDFSKNFKLKNNENSFRNKKEIKDIKHYNYNYYNKQIYSLKDNNINNKNGNSDILYNKKRNKDFLSSMSYKELMKNNNNINDIIKEYDYDVIKKFESIYTNKNNILMSLIKEFNDKIKDIYLYLYKKYINSIDNYDRIDRLCFNGSTQNIHNDKNNFNNIYEIILFDKNLIDFQENQIKYYTKLLELLEKYDNNEDILKFTEFYNNLNIYKYYIKNNNEKSLELKKPLKLKKMTSYKLINSKSSTTHSLTSINIINNKLPILKNKNNSLIEYKKYNNNILVSNNNEENIFQNDVGGKQLKNNDEEKIEKINNFHYLKRTKNNSLNIKKDIEIDNNINNKIKYITNNNNINNNLNNIKSNNNINNDSNIDVNKDVNDSIINNNKNEKRSTSNKKENKNNNNNNIVNKAVNKNKSNDKYNGSDNINHIDQEYNNKKKNNKIKKKLKRFNSEMDISDEKSSSDKSIEKITNNKNDKNNINDNNNIVIKKKEDKLQNIINSSIPINNNTNNIKHLLLTSKRKKRKSFSKFDFMI